MATIKGSSLGHCGTDAHWLWGGVSRCAGQLQMGAKHLYPGPQLTSPTQNQSHGAGRSHSLTDGETEVRGMELEYGLQVTGLGWQTVP